jgi:hypothetical protein
MDPPFLAKWQAGFCAVLILLMIALPAVLVSIGGLTRQEVYPTAPTEWGTFDLIQREIFQNTSDIDVLLVGSSNLYHGLDAPYLRDQLARSMGQPANVVMLPYNFRCDLLQYLLVRDILERRKVKMLVLVMPFEEEQYAKPHLRTHYWMLHGDESLNGLPSQLSSSLFASTILGSPRHLLSLIRPDLLEHSARSDDLGTLRAEKSLRGPYSYWHVKPVELPPGEMFYSKETEANFHFGGPPLTWFQKHYLRRTMDMVRKHDTGVVTLSVPEYWQRKNTAVQERVNWPEFFGMEIPMIGIPPSTLFNGLSDEEIDRLFADPKHFNRNGNEMFSRTITPALTEAYRRYVKQAR